MNKYEKYAELSKTVSVLEEQLATLRKEIESDLPEDGYKDELVTAYWTTKKKWTYPEKVTKAEEVYKAEKKLAETDGTATAEETKQLTIKVK